jgi:alkylhydroperoxidase/carboxymuconolactone decarboxylase family protein YurZ
VTAELYPAVTPDLARLPREHAPDAAAAFNEFGKEVFADGALPAKFKNIIAVAVAHVRAANDRSQHALATGEHHGHSI